MPGQQSPLIGRHVRLWKTPNNGYGPFLAKILDIRHGLMNVMSLDDKDANEGQERRCRYWINVAETGGVELLSDAEVRECEANFAEAQRRPSFPARP